MLPGATPSVLTPWALCSQGGSQGVVFVRCDGEHPFDVCFTQLLKKLHVPIIKFDTIRIRIINLLHMVDGSGGAIVKLHQQGSGHGMCPPVFAFSTVFV